MCKQEAPFTLEEKHAKLAEMEAGMAQADELAAKGDSLAAAAKHHPECGCDICERIRDLKVQMASASRGARMMIAALKDSISMQESVERMQSGAETNESHPTD